MTHDREPYCELEIDARPATFATAHEILWKEAVRTAIDESGVAPQPAGCFAVAVAFRTPAPKNSNDRWDLDNLIKPTLDAMEGVFGLRAWKGIRQPNDDKVVRIEATKRTVRAGESPGATIRVWLVDPNIR